MIRHAFLLSLACVVTAGAQSLIDLQSNGAVVQTAHLITFDGPGANQTYVSGVNNSGTVTGFYADNSGDHGFLRGLAGAFLTFDIHNAQSIYPDSINSGSAVAGNYTGANQHAFMRTPDGAIELFDLPGSLPSSSGNPLAINDSGFIAGAYFDGTTMHGFIRSAGGRLLTIDYPASTYTYATDINNNGVVTGIWDDASYNQHGFLRTADGQWTSFDVPGNSFSPFFPPALSVNDNGGVTGSYFQGSAHGFTWQAGSPLVTFDVPGSSGTTPVAINANGAVAGSYQDASFNYHGFVRTSAGTILTFSIPGAIGTYVVGINDNGVMAGWYQDASYVSHGFVIVPTSTQLLRLAVEPPAHTAHEFAP